VLMLLQVHCTNAIKIRSLKVAYDSNRVGQWQ
jgi:hypothetical protein